MIVENINKQINIQLALQNLNPAKFKNSPIKFRHFIDMRISTVASQAVAQTSTSSSAQVYIPLFQLSGGAQISLPSAKKQKNHKGNNRDQSNN